MLKKILLILVILLGLFAAFVATRPSDFKVSRSATMSAPASTIFAEVNDFHRWEHWSPWAKLDPKAKNAFEGPAAGEGAVFRWSGNKEVGEGSMTIVESRPPEFIKIRLDFVKPFAGTSYAEFSFKPEGEATQVTWTMEGKNNFIAKAIGVFMDCDRMIGGMFEKGLAQLKAVAEARK